MCISTSRPFDHASYPLALARNDFNSKRRKLVAETTEDDHRHPRIEVNPPEASSPFGGVSLLDYFVPPQACNKKPTKKQVRFSNDVHVRFTIAMGDISEDERQATWYSSDEFENITRSCLVQIQTLERGGDSMQEQQQGYCARGLESHTQLRAIAKTKTRSTAIQAVLEEQYQQTRLGEWNEEDIAQSYRNVSASSQLWAHAVGLQDQREAEDYNNDSL